LYILYPRKPVHCEGKAKRFQPWTGLFKASGTEVSRIYGQSPHGGGKVVSPTHRPPYPLHPGDTTGTGQLKCDCTRGATRFRITAKWTIPFKSARVLVQSTTGSRGVRTSSGNAGYTMFRGSVKGTGYPIHSSVSPSLPFPASPCAITFQLASTHFF